MKKMIVFCLAFSGLLTGCGGADVGSGGGSKLTCDMFAYQEDAQANYSKELDRDNDGIACESLPKRPVISTPIPTSVPSVSAAGVWAARYVTTPIEDFIWLNLPSGEYWALNWVNNKFAGLVQGNYSISGSNVLSNNGLDFDVATLNKPDALTFTGVVVPQISLELKTLVAGATNTTRLAYHSNNYLKADVAALAGNYSGRSYSKQYGSGVGEGFNLAADGKITSTVTACSYTGQLTAMPDVNAYRFSVTFGAAPCDNAGETMTGIAIKSVMGNEIIAAGLNGARNNAFVFVGAK